MKYSFDPLKEYQVWRRYAYRFLPAWAGALLLCLNSIAGNMTHSLSYYAAVNHLPTEYAFATGVALCLVFFVGLKMLYEGFRHANGILIPVAIVNTLLAIAYLENHSPTLLNLLPLFSALLYILVLNSKNHRRYTSMLRVKRRRKTRAAKSLIH
jgi:predicted tellurium resistance membrane protein TerC